MLLISVTLEVFQLASAEVLVMAVLPSMKLTSVTLEVFQLDRAEISAREEAP